MVTQNYPGTQIGDQFDKIEKNEINDNYVSKGTNQLLLERMEAEATALSLRTVSLIPSQANGMLSRKRCFCKVNNP